MRNNASHLKDRAPDIGGAFVSRQLCHQLLQEVCDDRGRKELPALGQDLAHSQRSIGAHSGMRVIQEALQMTDRWLE